MAMQALVMGFGGTGAQVLTFLKEMTVLKHGEQLDSVRFILFDTIADWKPGETVKILGGAAEETLAKSALGISLDPNTEYFFLKDHDPDLQKHVFDYLSSAGRPERYPHLKDWLHAGWLSKYISKAALNIAEGAAQQRQIGRFAMFQNAERIVAQIRQEIERLQTIARGTAVNIWIVGSAAGGTGAGCILDAAFMTRLAARNINITLSGIIVLPEVYEDKEGVSKGRAYSLFRELDRFQEVDMPISDRYIADTERVSSRVVYDSLGRQDARVASKLFDYLFYAGSPCRTDAARESFFTSVANSLDPYLDSSSGRTLLQNSINSLAAASSFGASRLYVPVETLADLFAWQEVKSYAEAAAVPILRGPIVADVAYGAVSDRQRDGRTRVENLLPLFNEILGLSTKTDQEVAAFARGLTPKRIVAEWYGFAAAAVAGMQLSEAELQVAKLTYVNPYVSWIEDDLDKVLPKDRSIRTLKEQREATKKTKESEPQSRDRFSRELEERTNLYKKAEAGEYTFEKGRRLVLDRVSQLLQRKVDDMVIQYIIQNPQFGSEMASREQGTTMTRLLQEMLEVQSDEGPLQKIHRTVTKMSAPLQGQEEALAQEAVASLNELKEWKPGGILSWGNPTIDQTQSTCREAQGDYIREYQKRRLLQDIQKLLEQLEGRFRQWTSAIQVIFRGLVRDEEHSCYVETRKQLTKLNGRLDRLARNPNALISVQQDPRNPDVTMQGYTERLREICVSPAGTSLFQEALSNSQWALSVDAKGRVRLELVLTLDGVARRYDEDKIFQLHQDLHDHFRHSIDARMASLDVFDYLLYLQNLPQSVTADQIGQSLNDKAHVLINSANAPPDTCLFVYVEPVDAQKRNLAEAIRASINRLLGNINVPHVPHSDRHSITLLNIRKPYVENITNLRDCLEDYLTWQREDETTRDPERQEKLRRALVYHPFRPELEAWHIERRHFRQKDIQDRDHIPPRIARLLEDPAMIQAFVHCIATGAVMKKDDSWLWQRTANEAVMLTDGKDEPEADVVRAAVVFALQQREGRKGGRAPIVLEDAEKSAVAAAQISGRSKNEVVAQFLKDKLEQFLDQNFPRRAAPSYDRERNGLKLIFEFYGAPLIRPRLDQRME